MSINELLESTKCMFCGKKGHNGLLCTYVVSLKLFKNGEIKQIELESREHMEDPGG